MTTTVTITQIDCVNKSDLDAHDEVWLFAQCDGGDGIRMPTQPLQTQSMAPPPKKANDPDDSTWSLNPHMVLRFEYGANLTLYEQDDILNLAYTDILGNARFSIDQMPSSPLTVRNGSYDDESDNSHEDSIDDATTEYTIHFTVS